jgi:GNAT superfamily N-acetyltransferase
MKGKFNVRAARPGDEDGIAQVRVDTWRSAYKEILPPEYLDSLNPGWYAPIWNSILKSGGSQGYAYVAVNEEGQVAGFAIGGFSRDANPEYRAELYAIYVLEAYQKQGLGKALVGEVVRRLMEEGMHSLIIWALEENPARKFYETLNGKVVDSRAITIGSRQYREVAYGWQDIHPLAELGDPPG